MFRQISLNFGRGREFLPNRWDLVAVPLVLGVILLFAHGSTRMAAPFELGQEMTISLDPWALPGYALRTTLRLIAAMAASLVFTFGYATLAAKSRHAGEIMLPVLDVLQSVPVLGYISFTVTAFIALFPGSLLGPEMAAIFAIFTAQAWNMAFSFHQSLRTTPRDLIDASAVFQLSGWQRFWRLEVPFALPGLIWNMMMSMSGSWFFIVASEAITVSDKKVTLPGMGAYIAAAIDQKNLPAIGYAMLAMFIVILAYDQLFFRPIVAWADKFKFEQTPGMVIPRSWLLDIFRRTRVLNEAFEPFRWVLTRLRRLSLPRVGRIRAQPLHIPEAAGTWADRVWYVALAIGAGYAGWSLYAFVSAAVGLDEFLHVLLIGFYTAARVFVLILAAVVIWVPIGVWIGMKPKAAEIAQPIAQFIAAFPANLLFPIAVILILRYQLNPNIWLSPLLILGTQWYILFNVIAGAAAFPSDMREAAITFRVGGLLWWRKVMLPGIYPYILTGAITASGGCWNASIVAEAVSWGDQTVTAQGIGAYITDVTAKGDFPRIVLGIAVLSVFVGITNRGFWRPLYAIAERRLRLG